MCNESMARSIYKYVKDNPPEIPVCRRGSILDEAKQIINGDRQDTYGNPEDSFKLIADLWNVYFEHGSFEQFGPKDVAMMMCLLKIARQIKQDKRDNLIDAVGYLALAGDME